MALLNGTHRIDTWRTTSNPHAGGEAAAPYTRVYQNVSCDKTPLPERLSNLFAQQGLTVTGEMDLIFFPETVTLLKDTDIHWDVDAQVGWNVAYPPKDWEDPLTGSIDHWEVVVNEMDRNAVPSEILAAYGL